MDQSRISRYILSTTGYHEPKWNNTIILKKKKIVRKKILKNVSNKIDILSSELVRTCLRFSDQNIKRKSSRSNSQEEIDKCGFVNLALQDF